MNVAREYGEQLDTLMNSKAEYFRVTPADQLPPLWVLIYLDRPASNHLTVFTWGVSEILHPAWTEGRPELTLSLQTDDYDWALALGHVAASQRGEIPFATGTVLDLGQPVTEDSPMTGFFLQDPISLPEGHSNRLTLSDREIHLMGAYPLHAAEIDRVSLLGLETFFTGGDYDPYSVSRTPRGT